MVLVDERDGCENKREFLIGEAIVVGYPFRTDIFIYIFARLPRILTLNHDKKKLPLSRENCWRNVEKSKDFGRQSAVWFQSEIVYVQRKKGREGGRESREENKSEKRGGRKEEERRGKKSERRTFFAVKFSSMDEMNCTRDHKSGRKGKSKTKPLLAVKVYGVWTLQGRQREPVCVCMCVWKRK